MEENFNDYFDFSDEQTEGLVDKYEMMLGQHTSHFFDVDDFLDIISYYSEKSKYDKALKAIEMALKQHPFSSEVLLLKASVFFHQRHYKKAFQQLKEIEHLEHSNPEFQLLKGNVFVQLKNMHQALESYYACLSMAEDDRYEFVEYIASYLVTTKNYKEALPFLEAGFEKDGFQFGLLYDMVITYEKLGYYNRLEKLLINGLEDDPFDAIFWDKLGDVFLRKEDTEKALNAYLYTIAINDSLTDVFEKIARLYYEKEDFANAIRYYEYLLEKEKFNTDYLLALAHCHYYAEQPQTAIRYFKRILLLDSENAEVYAALSLAEIELDLIEEAIKHLDLAISYDTKNTSFLLQKANLLVKLGFDGQAIELFEKKCYEQEYYTELCKVYVDFLIQTVFNVKIALIIEKMAIDKKIFQEHLHDFFNEFLEVNAHEIHGEQKQKINIYNLMTRLIMSFSLPTE